MKKALYYASLVILWIVVLFVLGILLIVTGFTPFELNWRYTLGAAVANPQILLISLGIVPLLRPMVYKLIFKETKSFWNSLALIILFLGLFWFSLNVGGKLLNYYTEKTLLKNNLIEEAKTEKAEEEIKEKLKNEFIKNCKELNKQLPMTVDEVTTLKAVTFVDLTFTCYYQVDFDVNDYDESERSNMMSELKEVGKQLIPPMISKGENKLTHEEIYDYFKLCDFKIRFAYNDKNNKFFGVINYDYNDFKPED